MMPFRGKVKALFTEASKAKGNFEKDRLFIEGHVDSVLVLNLKGEIVDFNSKMVLVFGYPPETFPMSFLPFVHPEDSKEVDQQFIRVLHGETVHYKCRIRHASGHFLTVEVTNIPIFEGELVRGAYGICRDVTPIEEMRHALASLKSMNQLTTAVPGTVFLRFAEDGSLIDYSPTLKILIGSTDILKKSKSDTLISKWVHEDDRLRLWSYIDGVKSGDETLPNMEIRVYHKTTGQYQEVMCKCDTYHVNDTGDRHVTCILYNLSESRRLTRALDEEQERWDRLFNGTTNAIYAIDASTKELLFHSPEFLSLFEIEETDLDQAWHHLEKRVQRKDIAEIKTAATRLLTEPFVDIVYRYRGNEGIKWIQERRIPHIDSQGQLLYTQCVASNITQMKRQEQEIWQLAMIDPISSLPNRTYLMETLKEWLTTRENFTVVTVSFDQVSHINRDFGHALGDEWIYATASIVESLSPNEAFLSHLYGDEFALLIPDVKDETTLTRSLQPLARLQHRKLEVGSYEWYPTVSIGVSKFPEDSKDPYELLKFANIAMTRSPQMDENAIQYYVSALDLDSYRRYSLGKDLHYACERNEFFLEYQPKVDAWSGEIKGVEALLRWQNPEWGRIPPNEFIPISEESGVHFDITDWVLREVCRLQSRRIRANERVVPISINVSPKQLMHRQFAERFIDTLQYYKLDAKWVEMEILETDILIDNQAIQETLNRLSSYGVHIALDDFGKGYSSISYLKHFPINTLKIDRQFIQSLGIDDRSRSLIRSLLFIAEEFDLNVVAEGVETFEQLRHLREMQCSTIQGYLFSRPLPLEILEEKLRSRYVTIELDDVDLEVTSIGQTNALVTLSKFRDLSVKLGSSPILIKSLNAKHVHFYSTIRLPVTEDAEFEIFFDDLDDMRVSVSPIQVIDLHNGMVEYTVEPKKQRDISYIQKKIRLQNA